MAKPARRKKPSRTPKSGGAKPGPASLKALKQALAKHEAESSDLFGVAAAIRDYYHDWRKSGGQDELKACAKFAKAYGDPALLAVLLEGYLADGAASGHASYFDLSCRNDVKIHQLMIDLYRKSGLDKTEAGRRLLDVMQSFKPKGDALDIVALDDELREVAQTVHEALETWTSRLTGIERAAAAVPEGETAEGSERTDEAPTMTMSVEFMKLIDCYATFSRKNGRAPSADELAKLAQAKPAAVASQYREVQGYVLRAQAQAAAREER